MNLLSNKITEHLQIRLRKRRNLFFFSLITPITKPLSILDIGGTVEFWENTDIINNSDFNITLLNLECFRSEYSNIHSIVGDARDLQIFDDNKFDIVFSNSVIEHVGDFYDQMKMAKEVQRVGKAYYVQTPNYYFPIEPHYRAIGFQFLPFNTKVYALQKFKMGRAEKITDRNSAINEANRIRLLKPKELKYLFPQANIFKERFFGFTKSLIAYYGFILK